MKSKTIILALVFACLLGILCWVRVIFVSAQTRSRSVFDDFDELLLKPDAEAHWWIRNHADGLIVEDQLCGDDSCVQIRQEEGISFADFALFLDAEPGDYTNVEMAELQSGYAYGEEGDWQPEAGQPIILETRVRWRGDFHQDGSGSAVGTSGIWLWNSPLDYISMDIHPIIAIGFSWASAESAISRGLAGVVMIGNFPVVVLAPSFDVDMTDWVDFKIEWKTDSSGQQAVNFWINDEFVGGKALPMPIDEALSVEIWHDNQAYKLSSIKFEDPVAEQAFQVDYIRVYQK